MNFRKLGRFFINLEQITFIEKEEKTGKIVFYLTSGLQRVYVYSTDSDYSEALKLLKYLENKL